MKTDFWGFLFSTVDVIKEPGFERWFHELRSREEVARTTFDPSEIECESTLEGSDDFGLNDEYDSTSATASFEIKHEERAHVKVRRQKDRKGWDIGEAVFSRVPKDENFLDPAVSALARKNLSVILRAMGNLSQTEIADRMGVNASTVSRLKSNGDLERACIVLAACGLELPSEEKQLYDKAFVDSLQVIVAAKLTPSNK